MNEWILKTNWTGPHQPLTAWGQPGASLALPEQGLVQFLQGWVPGPCTHPRQWIHVFVVRIFI